MTGEHLVSSALEAYVAGELDAEMSALVESHVAVCGACASQLAGEARLEVAFAEVAERSVAQRERSITRRSSFAAGVAIAMAASVMLFLAPRGHADETASPATAPSITFERPTLVEADASTASAQLEGSRDAAMKLGRD